VKAEAFVILALEGLFARFRSFGSDDLMSALTKIGEAFVISALRSNGASLRYSGP
jgi:hypothetical protein